MGQLGCAEAAGHDRRRKQHPVATRRLEQDLDLFAGEPSTPRFLHLQLLDLGLDWVVVDQVVVDRDVEDLAEPCERLVDRPIRAAGRPVPAPARAPSPTCTDRPRAR